MSDFDYKNPNYDDVFAERVDRLKRLRDTPEIVPQVKLFYKSNPIQFIADWAVTFDPRNAGSQQQTLIPFVLFPRQIEWLEWAIERWRAGEPGVSPKSRESGVSWLAISLSCTLCLFNEGMSVGFGSRVEDLVDKIGDPKSLFWKARAFLEWLPSEFRGGFNPKTDSPHMRILFRETNSFITGEAGKNIGRGNRTSLHIIDEAAFLENPVAVDAALSQTTRCRIDVSTVNGMGNPFHQKVTTWKPNRVFIFSWRDDPRKDEIWYERQKENLDPVTVAQEIDIDFAASVEGVLIPSAWVQSAIDSHLPRASGWLGFEPSGRRTASLDVADQGADKNAFCGAHGPLIECLDEWSGKGDDIFGTVQKVFHLCDDHGYTSFRYDADGLGAGVRGDARIINDNRLNKIVVEPFRGSSAVHRPENQDIKGRRNEDFFKNSKAQAWWALRTRFQKTHRAIIEGSPYQGDELISIPSSLALRNKLMAELSQPTWSLDAVGKVVIDKAPDGTRSPNLADAVMIQFAAGRSFAINPKLFEGV